MLSSSFTSNGDHLSFSGFLDNIFVDFPPFDNSNLKANSSSSGSDNIGETYLWEVSPSDHERKRKRMISNRESAKRSRMRKQKHLENLRNQLEQYKTGNHELMKRLLFVNHNGQLICRENERLRLESLILQQRLYFLNQLLVVPELHHVPSAWPCNNNVTAINEQNLPSLITF